MEILGLGLLIIYLLASSLLLNRNVVVCPPNRVAVITGRSRVLSDGRKVGYRIIKGGMSVCMPLIEKVS